MKKQKITPETVKDAYQTLLRYKEAKEPLNRRILENEEWFHLRHSTGRSQNGPITQSSAWLFNSIVNKHADAMDSYPTPCVLPREENDETDAKALSSILPVLLEQRDFEQTYSDVWWYKLKTGTGAYGVFWNTALQNGLGDVDVCQVDLLNLYWEPGVKQLQQSQNIFYANAVDKKLLLKKYPQFEKEIVKASSDLTFYLPETNYEYDDRALVIDWYYKKPVNGKLLLHYCKFVGSAVLFASENEELYQSTGFYNHGLYPFVLDTLFVTEGSPAGFGYMDTMKGCQAAIDKLDEVILKNAIVSESPRWFISDAAGINEEEYADWSNPFVHITGRVDDQTVKQVAVQNVSQSALQLLQFKVDEMKETSGNRDFSQGSTGSGVTAASAIQALQEAGNKLSRDMIRSSYRAYSAICNLVIELIRQFYTEPRTFRIVGEAKKREYITYTASGFAPDRARPIFDISVVPQKQSPYKKAEQNELAKELFTLGMLDPARKQEALSALSMMDFYGKEQLLEQIAKAEPKTNAEQEKNKK